MDGPPRHSRRRDLGGIDPQSHREAKAVVLLYSSGAINSEYILREVNHAITKKKRIVPFRLSNVEIASALGFCVSTSQWLDAFPHPLETHLKRLVETTQQIIVTVRGSVPKTEPKAPRSGSSKRSLVSVPVNPPLVPVTTRQDNRFPEKRTHFYKIGLAAGSLLALAVCGVFFLSGGGAPSAASSVAIAPITQGTLPLPVIASTQTYQGNGNCTGANMPPCRIAQANNYDDLPGMAQIDGDVDVVSIDTLHINNRYIKLARIGVDKSHAISKLDYWIRLNGPTVQCRPADGIHSKYYCDVGPSHLDISKHILEQGWATELGATFDNTARN